MVDLQLSILGGGQLSKMIAEGAAKHQIHTMALTDTSQEPACFSPAEIFVKKLDPDATEKFYKKSSCLTFENEFIDIPSLRSHLKSTASTIQIYPSLDNIALLQDKLQQKMLLDKLGIANACYKVFDSSVNAQDWLKSLPKYFGNTCILKWSKFGYDGKGTFFYEDNKDLDKAISFIELGLQKGAQIFAEQKIAFSSEVARSLVRSPNAKTLEFPLVLSEQKNGICAAAYGPATSFGVSPELEQLSLKALHTLASALNYIGVFAVEFFVTQDQRLLVNEIAPRVHNSAHYSQEACSLSQFEAHALAPFDLLPLKIETQPYFGMINLLGPPLHAYSRSSPEIPLTLFAIPDQTFLHWYGKVQIVESRKLGHINFFAHTPEGFVQRKAEAQKLAQDIFNFLQQESTQTL